MCGLMPECSIDDRQTSSIHENKTKTASRALTLVPVRSMIGELLWCYDLCTWRVHCFCFAVAATNPHPGQWKSHTPLVPLACRLASLHFFGRVDGGLIRIIVWGTHHDSLTFAVPMSPFHLLKSRSESSDYCKSGKKRADIPNIHSQRPNPKVNACSWSLPPG